jgi:hypothetical protein
MSHHLSHQTVYGAWRPGSLNQEGELLPNHGSRSCGQRQRRPIPGQFRRYRRRGKRLIVQGLPTGGGRFGPLPCSGPATGLPQPCLGHRVKRSFTFNFCVCTTALKPGRIYPPMPPKAQKAAAGRLIGYARVSTEEQGTDPQTDELRAAGCTAIREEHASGADRSRPEGVLIK